MDEDDGDDDGGDGYGDGNKPEDEVKGVTGKGNRDGDGGCDGSSGDNDKLAADASKATIGKAWEACKSYKPTTRESVELLQTANDAFGVDDESEEEKEEGDEDKNGDSKSKETAEPGECLWLLETLA